MKNEEAIEDIKSNCWELCDYSMDKCEDDCEMKVSVKAIEKQIPKKPKIKLHTNRVPKEQEEYYCPCCDEWITWDFKWKWCAECGQHLDWSEE